MADRANRAKSVEALLKMGVPAGLAMIQAALVKDFTPLSDHRASAMYRLRAAAGLVQRFQFERAEPAPLRIDAL
jgi:xanthine dehydrogenase small subunit